MDWLAPNSNKHAGLKAVYWDKHMRTNSFTIPKNQVLKCSVATGSSMDGSFMETPIADTRCNVVP